MCNKSGTLMRAVIAMRVIRYAISRSQDAVQCVSISRFDDRAIALTSGLTPTIAIIWRVPGAHACVVTRVNYPVDRARFANVLDFLCVYHYNQYHHSGRQYRSVVFFISFPPRPRLPTLRLPGNSVWFTGIRGRESTQASVACPSALHARIRLLTHPTRALIPRQLSDFRTEFLPRSTSCEKESPAKSVRHRTG